MTGRVAILFKVTIFVSPFLLFISLLPSRSHALDKPSPSGDRRLGPCQSCKALVSSFLLGMEKTAKGHYGGGDTAWEEENKKVYKNSELRLTEIQEGLCKELTSGKDQCHELASDHEHLLEEWWGSYRNAGEDLLTWLCVNKLEMCCNENHYGKDCLPCPGYPDNVCSKHGKCKGSGTRKGNGECSCDMGYAGKSCDKCAKDYYEIYSDNEKRLCSACHKACLGGCSGAGAKSCTTCKEGWENDAEKGCLDVNECLHDTTPCKHNEFCVNTEGSYSCIPCDKSCNGCFGDGPDMCSTCAEGFKMRDKVCLDETSKGQSDNMNTTRYFTYFGLCLATCIIFQKNTVVAAFIGIAVAVYISASEYLLNSGLGP